MKAFLASYPPNHYTAIVWGKFSGHIEAIIFRNRFYYFHSNLPKKILLYTLLYQIQVLQSSLLKVCYSTKINDCVILCVIKSNPTILILFLLFIHLSKICLKNSAIIFLRHKINLEKRCYLGKEIF